MATEVQSSAITYHSTPPTTHKFPQSSTSSYYLSRCVVCKHATTSFDSKYCSEHRSQLALYDVGVLTHMLEHKYEQDGRDIRYDSKGNRLCKAENDTCIRIARDVQSGYCSRHGGGARCEIKGCPNGAVAKSTVCARHGGGARCKQQGCLKAAIRASDGLCGEHGGGNRCSLDSCNKFARPNSSRCVNHGGGTQKRSLCEVLRCTKQALGRSRRCTKHGGKRYCGVCAKRTTHGDSYCENHKSASDIQVEH